MIYVNNISKIFKKDIAVIKNLNFQVTRNEFVSIVGPCGCGKTTLLNIIAGLEKATSGSVFCEGKEVNLLNLDAGLIFQDARLFPWKTILENVELALKARVGKKAVRTIANELLKKAGLLSFANFYPKEISNGMKQKASLMQTLALNPKILLMDEPFAALDAQTRALMQEELLKIWESDKKTIIFVTHNIEEAVFLSDKVLVLSPMPAKIAKIFDIDLPRPRKPEMQLTKEFCELKYEIWEMIRGEILKSYYCEEL